MISAVKFGKRDRNPYDGLTHNQRDRIHEDLTRQWYNIPTCSNTLQRKADLERRMLQLAKAKPV